MKITLVQADQRWEDKSLNLENYSYLLNTIQETDLILLPEMFHTGFTMNASELAENMDTGVGIEWLKANALEKNAAFYTSLIIEDSGHYYNRGVFVRPNGRIEYYDKRKCFGLAGEDEVYSAGNHQVIVEYLGWKIQLQICYDLRFPEIVRNHLSRYGNPDYDLILYVANWPEKRNLHWQSLLVARAIENQCYVAGLNRVGVDGNHLKYSGDSQLVNALGISEKLRPSNQETRTFVMNLNELNEIRESLPFLRDI